PMICAIGEWLANDGANEDPNKDRDEDEGDTFADCPVGFELHFTWHEIVDHLAGVGPASWTDPRRISRNLHGLTSIGFVRPCIVLREGADVSERQIGFARVRGRLESTWTWENLIGRSIRSNRSGRKLNHPIPIESKHILSGFEISPPTSSQKGVWIQLSLISRREEIATKDSLLDLFSSAELSPGPQLADPPRDSWSEAWVETAKRRGLLA